MGTKTGLWIDHRKAIVVFVTTLGKRPNRDHRISELDPLHT